LFRDILDSQGTRSLKVNMPTTSWPVDAASPSEQASLQGHKAKTPIIAGAVSGACIAAAWVIGFIIYFYKRHRREKRARALGFKSHREMLDPPKKPEVFVIPPDPAIVEGRFQPGDRVFPDPKHDGGGIPKHANTIPLAKGEAGFISDLAPAPPSKPPHTASSPAVVAKVSPNSSPSNSPSTNHDRQDPA